jgi:hemolysin activation/secretion protein
MPSPDRLHAVRTVVAACVLGMAATSVLAQPGAVPASTSFVLPPVHEGGALTGGPAADRFLLTRVRFEGHAAFNTAELEALAEPFLRRPIRLADVEELRQRITRAYIDRGHISSGAVLPADAFAQFERDGSLRLRVVEGVVSQVVQQGLQRLDPTYIASRLVREREILDVNVLQDRFRLLLADALFDSLNARLRPGDEPGRSTVEVDVVRAPAARFSLFANNHLAPAVGSSVGGVEGTLRNLTGWGDTLTGTLASSGGSDSHDLHWTLPLAARRTTLGLHVARGSSSVIEEPLKALDVGSTVDTRELTVSHPVVDESRRRLSLGLTWSQRRNRTTIGGEPFSFVAGEASGTTEVRAWRFFQDLVMRFDTHVLALRSTFVSGRNNLPDPPVLSSQPRRDYRLWIGQGQASFDAGGDGGSWVLRGQVQRSGDALVPLEQMSLGGRHTVRGYRENQLVRDNAYALSAEYHWPLLRSDTRRQSLTLVPFVDLGGANDHAGEHRRLASAGLGLQWTFADLEAEVFAARRLLRRPTDSSGDLQDRGFHLSLRYRAY